MTDETKEVVAQPNKGQEMWRYAQALSRASIIPKTFQGQPANCFVAMDMAERLGVGVMEIMQNTYVVHGTPGFSAKYAIGMANKSGVFKGPICFEERGSGDKLAVTAFAIVRETDQRVEFTCDMAMAKAEKWTSNPKYRTMPQLMLRYRASSLLIRTTCPQVLLGLQTAEELEDVRAARVPEFEAKVDALNDLIAEPSPESVRSDEGEEGTSEQPLAESERKGDMPDPAEFF
jgi:hypothetical protein